MVRPEIQLKRMTGELSREHYYLHTTSIISKKVKEMSVLTGANIFFLSFSPANGKPTLHLGDDSNFMDVVRRFCNVSYCDGEKRRHDNIQTLKANYQMEERYNIDVDKLFDLWKVKRIEDSSEDLRKLNKDLNDLLQKRRVLENPKKVMTFQKSKEMEQCLLKSIDGVRRRKEEMLVRFNEVVAERLMQSTMEPFEEYIPEMLRGNDDLLAYANTVLCGNDTCTSNQQDQSTRLA